MELDYDDDEFSEAPLTAETINSWQKSIINTLSNDFHFDNIDELVTAIMICLISGKHLLITVDDQLLPKDPAESNEINSNLNALVESVKYLLNVLVGMKAQVLDKTHDTSYARLLDSLLETVSSPAQPHQSPSAGDSASSNNANSKQARQTSSSSSGEHRRGSSETMGIAALKADRRSRLVHYSSFVGQSGSLHHQSQSRIAKDPAGSSHGLNKRSNSNMNMVTNNSGGIVGSAKRDNSNTSGSEQDRPQTLSRKRHTVSAGAPPLIPNLSIKKQAANAVIITHSRLEHVERSLEHLEHLSTILHQNKVAVGDVVYQLPKLHLMVLIVSSSTARFIPDSIVMQHMMYQLRIFGGQVPNCRETLSQVDVDNLTIPLIDPTDIDIMKAFVDKQVSMASLIKMFIRDICIELRTNPTLLGGVCLNARLDLELASKICAMLVFGSDYVTPEHVSVIAPNIISHRMRVRKLFRELHDPEIDDRNSLCDLVADALSKTMNPDPASR